MHRHSYKGRKFGRETDQRLALIRSLECALIENQSITTTLARAKEIRRTTEKLVTMAKKGGLSNRRLVIARLNSVSCGNLLVDVVAPQIKRDSGYTVRLGAISTTGDPEGEITEYGLASSLDVLNANDNSKEKNANYATKPAAKKPAAKKTAKKEDK